MNQRFKAQATTEKFQQKIQNIRKSAWANRCELVKIGEVQKIYRKPSRNLIEMFLIKRTRPRRLGLTRIILKQNKTENIWSISAHPKSIIFSWGILM